MSLTYLMQGGESITVDDSVAELYFLRLQRLLKLRADWDSNSLSYRPENICPEISPNRLRYGIELCIRGTSGYLATTSYKDLADYLLSESRQNAQKEASNIR